MKQKAAKYLAIFGALAITTFALLTVLTRLKNETKTGDSAQPDVPPSSQSDTTNKSAAFDYSTMVTVDTSARALSLYFKNADRSSKNLSLEIVGDIGGEQISLARTDTLKPGDEVRQLSLSYDRELAAGQYGGEFILHFYNDQAEEEIVNSKVKISLQVK